MQRYQNKKIQRKNKFYTNEHSSLLQAMSYLCPIYQEVYKGL
nr:MAG TPA: hypothetical protein [Caudoviricetes sp.]